MPFSGSLTKQSSFKRNVAGEISLSGELETPGIINQAIDGILSFTGALTKKLSSFRSFDGSIDFTGALTVPEPVPQEVNGLLGFIGAVTLKLAVSKSLSGTLDFAGRVVLKKNGIPVLTGAKSILLGRFNAFTGMIKDIGDWIRL